MTIELTPDVEQQLKAFAVNSERTPVEVVESALLEYLRFAQVLSREVADAEREADRDGWLTTEEAFARAGLKSDPSA